MKNTPLPLLLAVCLTVISPPHYADSVDISGPEGEPAPDSADAALNLSPERQRMTGLQSVPLESLELQAELHSSGKVLDLQGLLDLRARYHAALSQLSIAEAQLRVAQTNHQRLSQLHREAIVATRELIQSEAQLVAEQARCEGFRRNLREVREEALQAWGGELFRQAVENESPLFRALLARGQVLVLVSLPAGNTLARPNRPIKVSPAGDRQQAEDAEPISAAPRTDEITQGETWFFSAPASHLRSGMRLDAWLPQGGERRAGVLVPLSAVVWHEGKPWVYLKTGEGSFSRRPIAAHLEWGQAWFVDEGLEPGEEVVTTAAQTLLSEEFRRQIPTEDRDD